MKAFKIFIVVFLMFVFTFNVKAICSDTELNEFVSNMQLGYSLDKDETVVDENGKEYLIPQKYAYLIKIYPYSEKIKVMVKDSLSNEAEEAKYNENLEQYVYGSYIHYSPKTYTISIYGNEKSSCPNALISSAEITMPSFNEYSLYSTCENNDDEMCSIVYDSSNLTKEEFDKAMEDKAEKNRINNMSFFEKVGYYISKYWFFIVAPIIIISIIYGYKILSHKKRMRKL